MVYSTSNSLDYFSPIAQTYIATMANDDRFLIRVHSPVPKPNSDGTGIRMTTDYKMRSEVCSSSMIGLVSDK